MMNRFKKTSVSLFIFLPLLMMKTSEGLSRNENNLSTIYDELKKFQDKHPDYARLEEIGISIENRKILGLEISNPNTHPKKQNIILLSGGIHGDEFLGFEHQLTTLFLPPAAGEASSLFTFINEGGKVLFIPIQNPDGFSHNQRNNRAEKDLNRQFNSTPHKKESSSDKKNEIVWVKKWVESKLKNEKNQTKKLIIAIDYHCCKKALLYPASLTKQNRTLANEKKITSYAGSYFEKIKEKFISLFGKNYQIGLTENLLGYSTTGTAKDYYFETYDTLSFTFEGEKNIPIKEALSSQKTLIETLLKESNNQLSE